MIHEHHGHIVRAVPVDGDVAQRERRLHRVRPVDQNDSTRFCRRRVARPGLFDIHLFPPSQAPFQIRDQLFRVHVAGDPQDRVSRRIARAMPLRQHLTIELVNRLQCRGNVRRGMIAVYGAVEPLGCQETRRRSLLAQLGALALFELFKLPGGKARMQQDIHKYAEPVIEIVAQSGRADYRVG